MVHIYSIRKGNSVLLLVKIPVLSWFLIEHKSHIKRPYLKAESMCTTKRFEPMTPMNVVLIWKIYLILFPNIECKEDSGKRLIFILPFYNKLTFVHIRMIWSTFSMQVAQFSVDEKFKPVI